MINARFRVDREPYLKGILLCIRAHLLQVRYHKAQICEQHATLPLPRSRVQHTLSSLLTWTARKLAEVGRSIMAQITKEVACSLSYTCKAHPYGMSCSVQYY